MAGGADDFSRRTLFLAGAGGLYFGALGVRLLQLQVLGNREFRLQAIENQFNFVLSPASRGAIYDRFGVPLAVNRRDFRVMIMRDEAGGKDAMLSSIDAMGRLLSIPLPQLNQVKADAAVTPRYLPALIANNLSWEEFSIASVQSASFKGVRTEMGEARNYPLGPAFSHVLGYVAKANAKDVEDDPQSRHPGLRVGKEGLEKSEEIALRGRHGQIKLEVNAHGRVFREVHDPRLASVAGLDLVTSLDAELQQVAYEQFMAAEGRPAQSGSAIVMDAHTGHLLVMVSAPGYDPNKFVDGISGPDYRAYLEDEYRPLYHKAVRGLYPPGSTFKPVTAVAALEHGVTDGEETVNCPGYYVLGGNRFHCHRRQGHGRVNLHDAIKVSCDVYFYEMGRRMGAEKLMQTARKFGLGHAPEIGVPGIAGGYVPDNAWKLEHRHEPLQVYDALNMAIGQGMLVMTPLQLAVMAARVATQGLMVEPRLILEGAGATPVQQFGRMDSNPAHLHAAHLGMIAVANEAGGTGRGSLGPGLENVIMAGKTGTAQVRRITAAERAHGVRSNQSLPWNRRDHGLFISYVPAEQPRYVCSVVVEHGMGGALNAAPRARAILRATMLKQPMEKPLFKLPPRAVVGMAAAAPAPHPGRGIQKGVRAPEGKAS